MILLLAPGRWNRRDGYCGRQLTMSVSNDDAIPAAEAEVGFAMAKFP